MSEGRFLSGKGTLLVKLDEGDGPRWYHLSRGEKSWVLRTYSEQGVTSTQYSPGLPEILDEVEGTSPLDDEERRSPLVKQLTMEELQRVLNVKQAKFDDVEFWRGAFDRLDAALEAREPVAQQAAIPRQAVVPAIPLRSVYDTLVSFPARDAQEHLAQAMAQCPGRIAKLFEVSVRRFAEFNNPDEGLIGEASRKLVVAPADPRLVKDDAEVSAVLKERHAYLGSVENAPQLDFKVIERELVPERATGTGKRGRRIDWLAMNVHDQTPILAELKLRDDKNPFFALLQLLLYAAMLSTGPQQERLRAHYRMLSLPPPPQRDEEASRARLDLYVVLVDFPDKLQPFLDLARTTAQALVVEPLVASRIRRIVCLRANLKADGLRFVSEFAFDARHDEAAAPLARA